jgi:hypothetical protein
MTESEWLHGSDPPAMLKHLQGRLEADQMAARSNPFPRTALLRLQRGVPEKLLGYAVECCRRIDDLITDPASRQAIEAVGETARPLPADRGQRDAAVRAARGVVDRISQQVGGPAGALAPVASPAWAAWRLAAANWADPAEAHRAAEDVGRACQEGRCAHTTGPGQDPRRAHRAEAVAQSGILRELFGNPFQSGSVVLPEPRWFDFLVPSRRAASAARQMAREVAERMTFADMPRLGELLRAAGCTEANVLEHCAKAGGHVRGCWVLSAILDSPEG